MKFNPFGLRGRIQLRARMRRAIRQVVYSIPGWQERDKLRYELAFWLDHWNARFLSGHFWNDDLAALLGPLGEWPADAESGSLDYPAIRWLEARGHGLRVLKEAGIESSDFFTGKTVMDIGPGAVCFLEASGARVGIAIEPLAREFAAHGLLLPSDHVIYLPVAAEDLPLLNDSVDIVVSRNNLDHVADPAAVVSEVYRILRPGGSFILIVHLEPEASITEPHAFAADDIRTLTRQFMTVRETIYHGGRTETADTLAGVYRKQETT